MGITEMSKAHSQISLKTLHSAYSVSDAGVLAYPVRFLLLLFLMAFALYQHESSSIVIICKAFYTTEG